MFISLWSINNGTIPFILSNEFFHILFLYKLCSFASRHFHSYFTSLKLLEFVKNPIRTCPFKHILIIKIPSFLLWDSCTHHWLTLPMFKLRCKLSRMIVIVYLIPWSLDFDIEYFFKGHSLGFRVPNRIVIMMAYIIIHQ